MVIDFLLGIVIFIVFYYLGYLFGKYVIEKAYNREDKDNGDDF